MALPSGPDPFKDFRVSTISIPAAPGMDRLPLIWVDAIPVDAVGSVFASLPAYLHKTVEHLHFCRIPAQVETPAPDERIVGASDCSSLPPLFRLPYAGR